VDGIPPQAAGHDGDGPDQVRCGAEAASGACLKTLVPAEGMLVANARMESTTWTATVLGPPLGGAAIGLFGPVATCSTGGGTSWPTRCCARCSSTPWRSTG
jgi:hypothetical protein